MAGAMGPLAASAAGAAVEQPCPMAAPDDYSVSLHIAAVFILLGVSLLGSLAPVALHLSGTSRGVTTAIKLGTFFGIGTILSTATIHMLAPASEALSNPCLPAAWREAYGPWAFLFATAAMMGMHLVDYLVKGHYQRMVSQQQQQQLAQAAPAMPHVHVHTRGGCHEHTSAIVQALAEKDRRAAAAQRHAAEAAEHAALLSAEDGAADGSSAAAASSSRPPRSGCRGGSCKGANGLCSGICSMEGEELCVPLLVKERREQSLAAACVSVAEDASHVIGLYMTEAGIIFHSLMIGVTLGVTGGAAFATLLTALALHQLFEGFAIGSAAVDSGLSATRAVAMGLAFSITTPLGIGIGIAVRASFSTSTAGALLASGIADALSAGVLLFVCLVDLLQPMMTDSEWLRSQHWAMQVLAFGAFYSGAAAMALIGRWL